MIRESYRTTPPKRKKLGAAGEHAITIMKSGYELWQRKISARTGKTSIAAELERDAKPVSQPE
jgi:hypothetical protein